MVFRVLPAPSQTLISWWDDKSDLDLEPVYQRKGQVWTLRQKQGLIDTIFNSFDIPKLYFADFALLDSVLNKNRKKYAVIDGKQRMLAIFGFFENDFPLSSKFVMDEYPELKLGRLYYRDLAARHPKIARKFENASLSIMSVITDDEQKINELFIRLNSSKPLVGAEIRNAMLGEVPQLLREMVEHPFWNKTRFNKIRGQDKNLAAKLLLLEHAGTFVDTKKKQLDALVSSANEKGEAEAGEEDDSEDITPEDVAEVVVSSESSDIQRSYQRVIKHLDRIAQNFIDDDPLLGQQAQIPVIYWLSRESSDTQLTHLRPFLEQFEKERAANRARAADDDARDQVLNDFELMARSSNDQASISGRYRIVRERFDRYLASL